MRNDATSQLKIWLLHGLFGDKGNMGGLLRTLNDAGWDAEAVDLPGHGAGSRMNTLTLEAMAEYIYQTHLACSTGRNVLVGHSLGGKVAMQIANVYSARLQGIVVLDIAPIRYEPRHSHVFEAISQGIIQQPANRASLEQLLFLYLDTPALVKFLIRSARWCDGRLSWRFDVQGLNNHYLDLCGMPSADHASLLPALFVKGALSDYLIADYWPEIQGRFPNASVRVIPNTGHWLHTDKVEVVAALIRRFCADL